MDERIIEILKNSKLIKKGRNTEIFDTGEYIVKVFNYKNVIDKLFHLKGRRSFIFSKILKLRGINVPEPIKLISKNNKEYFIYKKIQGEQLIEILKKKKDPLLLNQLISFIDLLFKKKVYHKDFDVTNIIVDENNTLYLIDLENISFFLTQNKKRKMIEKVNKFLKKYLNFTVDLTNFK